MKSSILMMVLLFAIWSIWKAEAISQNSLAQEDTPCALAASQLEGAVPGEDYESGIISITLTAESEGINSAIFTASQEGTAITTVATFDSVSSAYGLNKISSVPDFSSRYKRGFILDFPKEADLIPIIKAYNSLTYVECAEAIIIYKTAELRQSWGSIKANSNIGEFP